MIGGCGGSDEDAKMAPTPSAIVKSWSSPTTQDAIAQAIAESNAFRGLTLRQVVALLGQPDEEVPPYEDSMAPSGLGHVWYGEGCGRDAPPKECWVLSLEMENGRVIDATAPRSK